MSRTIALLALIGCFALAACGSSDKSKGAAGTGSSTTTTATEPAAKSDCATVAAPKPKGEQRLSKPHLKLDRAKTYVVQMTTNCGEIDIELDVKSAPKTAASVASLVKQGFYDNLTFHRISAPGGSDFVIQGGDPLGTGQGGPGYSITERPPSDAQYTRGVVAMAKTAVEKPGTSGSQFFIVTAEDAGLPPDYAIAGKVVKGDDSVAKIAAVPADAQEAPQAPVVIESAKLVER